MAALALASLGATGVGAAAAATVPASSPAATVWLCRPGMADDPCTPGLTTTVATPSGRVVGTTAPTATAHPAIDCFYVYPTVSDQKTANADLTIDPTERSIALYQAARFSSECRVFAPMYRQLTISAINGQVTGAESALAYSDVLTAWRTYLRQYNHGRGVVLIGHSQGSFMLRQLIATQIDPTAAARRRLVSAVLLGGNVTVKQGSDVGGDFKHIRACRAASQTGCVIAYSTFDAAPPSNSLFGRTTAPGLQVLCTNPAALGGGVGVLNPILPSAPFAPGSSIAAGIALLGYSVPPATHHLGLGPGGLHRPVRHGRRGQRPPGHPPTGAPLIHASPTPGWGLHLVDVNLGLGNLVAIVHRQAAAYSSSH